MSGAWMEKVEQQTRLAGHNRVAMLLFRMGDEQLFGINVFKVQEVLSMPALFHLPSLPAAFTRLPCSATAVNASSWAKE